MSIEICEIKISIEDILKQLLTEVQANRGARIDDIKITLGDRAQAEPEYDAEGYRITRQYLIGSSEPLVFRGLHKSDPRCRANPGVHHASAGEPR